MNCRFLVFLLLSATFLSCKSDSKLLGTLTSGANVHFVENENGAWGISLIRNDIADFYQTAPVQLEFFKNDSIQYLSTPYSTVSIANGKAICRATVVWKECLFQVKDIWSVEDNELVLNKNIILQGSEEGGFMSSISLYGMQNFTRKKADFFAPGMIYGDPSNLNRKAIGGIETNGQIRIREDRLPAPLFASMFNDGSTVAVFDPQPKGNTIQEDSEDYKAKPLIDQRL